MRPPAARSSLRSALRAVAALTSIALLAGCMLPPHPVTEVGRDVFNLYVLLLVLAAIVFVGVEGFIVYAIVRYRRRPGDDTLPPQTHGNTLVEIIWTAIPTVIVLILFVFSMITLGAIEARAEEPGVTVEVEGFQWDWVFRYPDGVSSGPGTATEPPVLGLPINEPVRLVLLSDNVIHAFFVPEFLIKRDMIPLGEGGTPNELEFTITEAGTYTGQCAEFCGTDHADMTFTIEAMERPDYDAWLAAIASGETPAPEPGECTAPVEISADDLAFDTDAFEVPAAEAFCIEFTNNDSALHDIAIEDTDFDGEEIAGGESTTYEVPPLEAGTYTFYCTLHPREMVGEITVTE